MTVEELNIKITADASGFKNEMKAASQQLEKLKADAVNAGKAVTDAFSGLFDTQVSAAAGSAVQRGGNASAVTEAVRQGLQNKVTADTGRIGAVLASSGSFPNGGGAVMPDFISYYTAQTGNAGTANVLRLDKNETLIGAVSGSDAQGAQPINITTTVELDSDKVGESVNSFFMRRSRITNGIEE